MNDATQDMIDAAKNNTTTPVPADAGDPGAPGAAAGASQPSLAEESLAANIATAKEILKAGHVPAARVAAWLHAQVPGAFKDEAQAHAAILE